MLKHSLLPFAAIVVLGGCASGREIGPPTLLTQVPAASMTTCIGQVLQVAPTSAAKGYLIEAPGQRYQVARDKVQTVVTAERSVAFIAREPLDAAMRCHLSLVQNLASASPAQ